MPVRREHCGAGVIGGKIYIVGGRTDTIRGFEPTSLVFDPASPGYAQRKADPPPRAAASRRLSSAASSTSSAARGTPNATEGVFPNVDAYEPATDSWSALPNLALPRHGLGAALIDGLVYLPGGASREGGGAVDYFSVYDVDDGAPPSGRHPTEGVPAPGRHPAVTRVPPRAAAGGIRFAVLRRGGGWNASAGVAHLGMVLMGFGACSSGGSVGGDGGSLTTGTGGVGPDGAVMTGRPDPAVPIRRHRLPPDPLTMAPEDWQSTSTIRAATSGGTPRSSTTA